MRLVTSLANNPTRMLRTHHLRKRLWFGDVFFMAAGAEHGGIGKLRHHRSRILGVPGKRAVAGFAVHARVLAGLLYFQNVAVAVFTTLVTGIGHRLGGKLGQRVSAIVAVLSKTLGNEVGSQQKKQGDPNCENRREPEEMFGVLESVHAHPGAEPRAIMLGGSEWFTLLQQPLAAYSDAAHIEL